MELLSYFLLVLLAHQVFVGFKISIKWFNGRASVISSNSIVMVLFLIYVLFSAVLPIIFDDFVFTWAVAYGGAEQCVYALVLCVFAIFVYNYSYLFFGSYYKNRIISSSIVVRDDDNFYYLLYFMAAIGVVLRILIVYKIGGLSSAISQMSGGVREALAIDNRDALVGLLRSFATIGDFAVTLLLCQLIIGRRGGVVLGCLYLALFLFVMFLSYISSGKRTSLAEYIIAILVVYFYRVKFFGIVWSVLLVALAVGFGWVTLWFRSIYAASVSGIYISFDDAHWSHGSLLGMYFFNLEFAFFESIVLSMQSKDIILDMFGGSLLSFYTTNIEPIFYLVPRAIWSGKPNFFYDMSHAVGAVMFNVSLEESIVGIAPSYIGTMWIVGGAIAVFFYSTFVAFISAYSDTWFKYRGVKMDGVGCILYSMMIFSAFIFWRQGGIGYSVIAIITSQIGHILGLFLIFGYIKR